MARRAAILVSGSIIVALLAGAPALAEPESNNAPATPSAPASQSAQAYALDTLPRKIARRGAVPCPKVELVDYRGDTIRFSPATKVFTGFRDRLAKFERVVQEVGIEVYGRAPSRILNLGTYVCRRMTSHSDWVSEHSLGNAIDIEGFDFGPLPKGATLPAGLHGSLKNGFDIRIQKHWRAKAGIPAVHSRFLKTLARRLIGRKDIFRILLGPGYPGHTTHFHFDMSYFRMVQIFDEGELLTAEPSPRDPKSSTPAPASE